MRKILRDIDDSCLSVNDAFERFITAKRSEGRRAATIRSYTVSFKDFKKFCFDNEITNIQSVNKDIVNLYKEHLLNLNISDESKNTYLRAVKAVLYFLMDDEILPVFKIKLFPAPAKDRVSTFTDDELKLLINCDYKNSKSFSEVRDYYMMLTLLLTGIRRSTLVNIMINDIDFENDRIHLRHIKRENEFKIKEIPLGSDLKGLLQKYLKTTRLREQKVKYLFPNVEGNMLYPDSVSRHITDLCKAAGVEPRSCHEFRRTFATKCYDKLNSSEETRKLMLISDPRVLKHYINEDLGNLQEESQKLNFVSQIQSPRILQGKIDKNNKD